jgi:hypothetical protein
MNQAPHDLIRFVGFGVYVLAVSFGGWWRRHRAKRNKELSEVLRRPADESVVTVVGVAIGGEGVDA